MMKSNFFGNKHGPASKDTSTVLMNHDPDVEDAAQASQGRNEDNDEVIDVDNMEPKEMDATEEDNNDENDGQETGKGNEESAVDDIKHKATCTKVVAEISTKNKCQKVVRFTEGESKLTDTSQDLVMTAYAEAATNSFLVAFKLELGSYSQHALMCWPH